MHLAKICECGLIFSVLASIPIARISVQSQTTYYYLDFDLYNVHRTIWTFVLTNKKQTDIFFYNNSKVWQFRCGLLFINRENVIVQKKILQSTKWATIWFCYKNDENLLETWFHGTNLKRKKYNLTSGNWSNKSFTTKFI